MGSPDLPALGSKKIKNGVEKESKKSKKRERVEKVEKELKFPLQLFLDSAFNFF